jgi:hypothetical protein
VLADVDAAPVDDKVKAMIHYLEKVTLEPGALLPEDAARVLAHGVTPKAIEDALMVAFCFNLITRLADSFGWHIPDEGGFQASGKSLLERGYLMPMRSKPVRAPEDRSPEKRGRR